MKITIDEAVCKKHMLSLEEVVILIAIKSNRNLYGIVHDLLEKEALVEHDGELFLTQHWNDVLQETLIDSEEIIDNDTIESLAKALMEIFPKGKKDGTNTYWRGNLKDNILRLKKFFKLYGNNFTPEELVEAAKTYVNSFNGQYKFMRTLKYFIWKSARKVDSEGKEFIEEVSELASILENKGEEVPQDWTTTLI